jgi:hypothetical protein
MSKLERFGAHELSVMAFVRKNMTILIDLIICCAKMQQLPCHFAISPHGH